MATVHLIHGFVGSGKTTFAKQLEQSGNKIRFSCDEWMIALFGSNPPQVYFDRYLNPIKNLMWLEAKKFLELRYDVILDFGFWKKAERDCYRALAKEIAVPVKLYSLQCSDKLLFKRVLDRTSAMPSGAFYIDENALNEFKQVFEPVDPNIEECIFIKTD